jgi:hypothetical protein
MKLDLTLFSICLVSALSNCGYALIAPFLPLEFESKGVSLTLMGYIFR